MWTDEKIDVLKRVAKAGGSYQDAADELGVSRNAVAGKAHREGITFACAPELFAARAGAAGRRAWAKLTPAAKLRRLMASTYRTPNHRNRAGAAG